MLNRTNLLIAALAIGLIFVLTRAQAQQHASPSSQIGRYLLFSADYDDFITLPVSNQQHYKVILRIDTQTGNVDQWLMGNRGPDKPIDTWVPTGGFPLPPR